MDGATALLDEPMPCLVATPGNGIHRLVAKVTVTGFHLGVTKSKTARGGGVKAEVLFHGEVASGQ